MILKENILMISEEEQLNRNCMTCEVRDICSKCLSLPSYMDAAQYCYIRKNQPEIEQYMIAASALQLLMNGTSFFKNLKLSDLYVSNQYVSQYFKLEQQGQTDSHVHKHILLFHVNDQHIVYDMNSSNIKRINLIMAYILEGLFKGFEKKEILSQMIETFQVQEKQATELYHKMVDLCVKENILKSKVGATL